MNQRTCVKHEKTFQERLDEQARDGAEKIPPGTARDGLLRRTTQADTASRGEVALVSRIAVADMTDISKAPILLHATDALRRARKLPAGAARNDLRQLARGLRDLYRTGAYAHLQSLDSPPSSSESMR